MTNTEGMTNTELEAALHEAVEWSNWYCEAEDWKASEWWGLVAEGLQGEWDRRKQAHPVS